MKRHLVLVIASMAILLSVADAHAQRKACIDACQDRVQRRVERIEREFGAGQRPSQKSQPARRTVRDYAQAGRRFEEKGRRYFGRTEQDYKQQVTIVTDKGTRFRIDYIKVERIGIENQRTVFRLREFKASQNAPLTPNQKRGFAELEKYGGRVVGRGKPGIPGGTRIPPTRVDQIRAKADRI